MKLKTLTTSVAAALLIGGAGAAVAAQEVVCDQMPTATTPASCRIKGTSERVTVQSSSAQYVVQPVQPSTNLVVTEPAEQRVLVTQPAERVVVTEPARVVAGTAVEPINMTYYTESPYPFPSPEVQPVQSKVYVPVEQRELKGPPQPRFPHNPTD
jgi:hypothetical protein